MRKSIIGIGIVIIALLLSGCNTSSSKKTKMSKGEHDALMSCNLLDSSMEDISGKLVVVNGVTSCTSGQAKVILYCSKSFRDATVGEINDGIFSVTYPTLNKCSYPSTKVIVKSSYRIIYERMLKKAKLIK